MSRLVAPAPARAGAAGRCLATRRPEGSSVSAVLLVARTAGQRIAVGVGPEPVPVRLTEQLVLDAVVVGRADVDAALVEPDRVARVDAGVLQAGDALVVTLVRVGRVGPGAEDGVEV